jgi:hypothetical protein
LAVFGLFAQIVYVIPGESRNPAKQKNLRQRDLDNGWRRYDESVEPALSYSARRT